MDTHFQTYATVEKTVKTTDVYRMRTARLVKSLIVVLWTFLGTALKKRMNQLQTFKRATGIEIWKTSPTKTENNGVFIPKK